MSDYSINGSKYGNNDDNAIEEDVQTSPTKNVEDETSWFSNPFYWKLNPYNWFNNKYTGGIKKRKTIKKHSKKHSKTIKKHSKKHSKTIKKHSKNHSKTIKHNSKQK